MSLILYVAAGVLLAFLVMGLLASDDGAGCGCFLLVLIVAGVLFYLIL